MKLRLALLLVCLAAIVSAQSPGFTVVVVASGATPALTTNAGFTIFQWTLNATAVTSSTFSSAAVGAGALQLCEDGTGGRTSPVFPTNFTNFTALQSTAASYCETYVWEYDGTNVIALGRIGNAGGSVTGAVTALVIASNASLPGSPTTTTQAANDNSTKVATTAYVDVKGIAQNSQSAAYTTVLADAQKHIYHPGADTTARTWTIDSNANVAYPVGTTLTFVNDTSAGVITIAITSDTLILAGAGTTGSRTLAANGIATAIKVTSTRWVINGTGLT